MTFEISGIAKRFGAVDVLRGIELGVAKGELIALLGPSGSGKTTLLKIIAGLVWPDAGRLLVDGTDWLELSASERRIGFVFQHYALFPHMTVRENIAFGLSVRPRRIRPGEAAIAERTARLMEFLQIADLADRHPARLSGGQRQRVALGRALHVELLFNDLNAVGAFAAASTLTLIAVVALVAKAFLETRERRRETVRSLAHRRRRGNRA